MPDVPKRTPTRSPLERAEALGALWRALQTRDLFELDVRLCAIPRWFVNEHESVRELCALVPVALGLVERFVRRDVTAAAKLASLLTPDGIRIVLREPAR
jgi:hypothetical protein